MHNFDKIIDRRHTDSLKWDFMPVAGQTHNHDLLPMWVSDYDFSAPAPVLAALQQRVTQGVFGYSVRSQNYFNAVTDWFARRHQLTVDPQWICSVEGVVPGLALLIQMLSEPGQAVVIQGPYYGSFARVISLNQRRVLENPLQMDSETGYRMDLVQLQTLLEAHRPPVMILCNPHNPCGRCWSHEELSALLSLCQHYQVTLISDEIWCDLLLPGARFTSLLAVNQAQQPPVIVANSVSKTFGLSGLRIANFVVADGRLRQRFSERLDAHGLDVFNVLAMTAATAAYCHAESWLDQLLVYLADNRQWFCQQMTRYIPWARIIPAQASYLLWLDCRQLGLDDDALKHTIISQAKIVPSMGIGFGAQGCGFIRLNAGCPRQHLQQAIAGLKCIRG